MQKKNLSPSARELKHIFKIQADTPLERYQLELARIRDEHQDDDRLQSLLHTPLSQAPRTEVGTSVRMWARFGHNLRFVAEYRKWYKWTGKMWAEAPNDYLKQLAISATSYILAEAETFMQGENPNESEWQAHKKYFRAAQSARAIESAIELLKGQPDILIEFQMLNQDDWMLNCQNGVLELRTGQLLPHKREYYMTKICETYWDPQATAPRWEQYLQKAHLGDKYTIRLIQQYCGLGLVGEILAQAFMVHYGTGGNGKNFLPAVLQKVLGKYAQQAPATLFVDRKTDAQTNDIARTENIRLLIASETEEGARLNTALVKQMTGNDKISVRYLWGEFFDLTPKFTAMMFTNPRPTIKDSSNGIWRRLLLIHWEYNFEDDPERKDLPVLLREMEPEYPGVLKWLWEGLQLYLKHGRLLVPEKVKREVDLYRRETDLIADFLEMWVVNAPGERVPKARLYETYKFYMEQTGHRALAENKLTPLLRDKGLQEIRTKAGRYWADVRLRTPDEIHDDDMDTVHEEDIEVF